MCWGHLSHLLNSFVVVNTHNLPDHRLRYLLIAQRDPEALGASRCAISLAEDSSVHC